MSDDATPAKVRLTDGLGPAAWAVVAFGRVQELVARADVADELVCKWRASDPETTAVPLYTWAAVEAEREELRTFVQQTACVRDGWHPFTALAFQSELLMALDDRA